MVWENLIFKMVITWCDFNQNKFSNDFQFLYVIVGVIERMREKELNRKKE
jgi:hypothetical protein